MCKLEVWGRSCVLMLVGIVGKRWLVWTFWVYRVVLDLYFGIFKGK